MYDPGVSHSYRSVLWPLVGRYQGHEVKGLVSAIFSKWYVPGSLNAEAMNEDKVNPNKYLDISTRNSRTGETPTQR
jgi:hypothetical protein